MEAEPAFLSLPRLACVDAAARSSTPPETLLLTPVTARQKVIHTGQQLVYIEGLLQELLHVTPLELHPVGCRRHPHHRYVRRALVLTEHVVEPKAINTRQHDIQQDQLNLYRFEYLERIYSVSRYDGCDARYVAQDLP